MPDLPRRHDRASGRQVSALEVEDLERRPWKRHCECGAGITLVGKVENDEHDRRLIEEWERIHSGFGHEDRVTSAEAVRIRHAGRLNRSYVRAADRG